jgi:hypothetical protein
MSERGGSNTKPMARRREDVQHEYRQHGAKSAATVSGIRRDTLSRLPRQRRLRPRASRRQTTRPMTRHIPQGTQHEQ